MFHVTIIFCALLATAALSEQCAEDDAHCHTLSYLTSECGSEAIAELLAKNIDSSSDTSEEVRLSLLRNSQKAEKDLQALQHYLQSTEFTDSTLPAVSARIRKNLGQCFDSSVTGFSDTLCKVPNSAIRSAALEAHGVPTPIQAQLNQNFGSHMPKQAVQKLLAKNAERLSKELTRQQQLLQKCMRRIDTLATNLSSD